MVNTEGFCQQTTVPVSTPSKNDSSEKDQKSLLQMTMSENKLQNATFESEMASEPAEYRQPTVSSNDSAPEVMTSQLRQHPTEPTLQQSDKPEGSLAQQSCRPSSYQDDSLTDEMQSTVEGPRNGSTLSHRLNEVVQTEKTGTHSEQDQDKEKQEQHYWLEVEEHNAVRYLDDEQGDAEYYDVNLSSESVMIVPTKPKKSTSISPELSVTSDLSFGQFYGEIRPGNMLYPDATKEVVPGELLSSADEECSNVGQFSDGFVHVIPEYFSDWSESSQSLSVLDAKYAVIN